MTIFISGFLKRGGGSAREDVISDSGNDEGKVLIDIPDKLNDGHERYWRWRRRERRDADEEEEEVVMMEVDFEENCYDEVKGGGAGIKEEFENKERNEKEKEWEVKIQQAAKGGEGKDCADGGGLWRKLLTRR